MSSERFPTLFSAFRFAGIELQNRIVMPAMTTNFGNADGSVSERMIAYYETRAKGGAGMLIVEPACVEYPRGKGLLNELDISTDASIAGLKRLAAVIQKHGVRAAIQLHHAGWLRFHCEPIVAAPVSSSELAYRGYDTPDALGAADIEAIVDQYGQAAVRAQQAGFDAVEIHAAHGYLVAQFLSPRFNRRTDAYGGTLSKRARFLLEILESVRRKTQGLLPVVCRIDADEFADDGITIEQSTAISKLLEHAGANAVHVSINSTPAKSSREIVSNVPPMGSAEGSWVHLAKQIKSACALPVIAVGNIRTPEFAEKQLDSGKADLIAIGRQLIADPLWPRKVCEADPGPIRPCISCNSCIRAVTAQKSVLACTVNAEAGRELQYKPTSPSKIRRILVVGGGPAGMEAAAAAARRGHEVHLWEKASTLGGQLQLAAVPPEKGILLKLLDYLNLCLHQSGVSVRSGFSWTVDDVAALAPDLAILATGSQAGKPPVLKTGECCNVHSARQVLAGSVVTGKKILITGGGAVGCEVADYLCNKCSAICVVEQKALLAPDMDPIRRRKLLLRLQNAGVDMRVNTRLLRITAKGGEIASLEGAYELIEADTIVHAGESKPCRVDQDQFKNVVPEFYTIGDAMKPRGILEAIMEGSMVGHRI